MQEKVTLLKDKEELAEVYKKIQEENVQ